MLEDRVLSDNNPYAKNSTNSNKQLPDINFLMAYNVRDISTMRRSF